MVLLPALEVAPPPPQPAIQIKVQNTAQSENLDTLLSFY
jgi:hypothetical protein